MGKPLNVLIVEDSDDDALLLVRELEHSGYDLYYLRVDTPEAMHAALEKQEWDVILSDYVLPSFSGTRALKVMQDSGMDVSFIIVSGNIGKDVAVELMKAGAHDYIMKSNLSRLVPVVERELREAGIRSERREYDIQIKQSLQEKELLLREIHHRVKNNMQIISSLLRLQSRYVTDEKYLEMFKDSQNRIMSMALVHEKLYDSNDLTRINIKNYINDLVGNLLESYRMDKNITIMDASIDDVALGIDAAIPCGLIISELVSNSLKHAFPDNTGGGIRISLSRTDDTVKLIISDNGIGLPEAVDFRNTESLGLRLVTILTENQLNGEINLNRNNGTEFNITFKGGKEDERFTDISS